MTYRLGRRVVYYQTEPQWRDKNQTLIPHASLSSTLFLFLILISKKSSFVLVDREKVKKGKSLKLKKYIFFLIPFYCHRVLNTLLVRSEEIDVNWSNKLEIYKNIILTVSVS